MPEKASEPPHCIPTSRSLRGSGTRFLSFSRLSLRSAISRIAFITASWPLWSCRMMTFSGVFSSGQRAQKRSGVNFSQPRPTSMNSPPKFGCRAMLRMRRWGTLASGASIATPQPYWWLTVTTSSTLGYLGSRSRRIREMASFTTPMTHCTVVLIQRMLRVPPGPSPQGLG